jgi:hypothetical protein
MHWKPERIILLALVVITAITIYPPFEWGAERISHVPQSPSDRRDYLRSREYRSAKAEYDRNKERLPIKARGFLFGSNKGNFFDYWGWDDNTNQSVPVFYTLDRKLLITDLLLEYAIVLLITTCLLLWKTKTFIPIFNKMFSNKGAGRITVPVPQGYDFERWFNMTSGMGSRHGLSTAQLKQFYAALDRAADAYDANDCVSLVKAQQEASFFLGTNSAQD